MPDLSSDTVSPATPVKIKALHALSSHGFRSCQRTLERAEGNIALAMGYLKYEGSAVAIKGSREKWEREMAEQYAKDHPLEEFYFRLHLTENEHWCVEGDIQEWMSKFSGITLMYYRTMKNGHIPMLREAKVIGTRGKVAEFKRWLIEDQKTILEPNEPGL